MNSIYSYDKYRPFLRDYYLDQKKASPGYSYAKFAADAGLNSPNYLKLVIDADRNLTGANIQQFAKALKLSFDELAYFEALVFREQASTKEEKAYYSKRVSILRSSKPARGIRLRFHEFVSKWYFPAIVFGLNGRQESVELDQIAKMIGLSEEQLKEGMAILKKKKILEIKDGKFSCDANHIVYHDPKLSNIHQKNYLKEQLGRSQMAFQRRYAKGAKFYSHTFTVPASEFSRYESQLNSFIESLIAQADEGPPEKMAQLNLQFFTLDE